MRLKVICRAFAPVFAVLTAVIVIFACPDIGGGPGRVSTPYKGEIKLTDVTTVKEFASKSRTVRDLVIAGTHAPGGGVNVALMYANGSSLVGSPMFRIQGTNDAGTNVVIDFSEIRSLLVSADRGPSSALVEVIQFPAISPADLLQKKPSFTDLEKNYLKDVRLHVKTTGPGGRVLCLVAKEKESGPYRIVAKFSDLATNSKIDFGYGMFLWQTLPLPAIWWAISSVTDDSRYPFRNVVVKD
jgi:hypothetical protein